MAHDSKLHVGRLAGVMAFLIVLSVVGGWLAGCRAARIPQSRDTHLYQGEILHGRVPATRPEQAFTFQGVESSLLDITVQADEGNQAAPNVRLFDPEGRELPVKRAIVSPKGAATLKVRDVPLVATGTYRVVAEPARATSPKGFYTFRYRMHFPGPVPKAMRMSARAPQPIEFTAPRYSRVVARITPRSRMRPDVMAVYDPDGGPALDRSQVPRGSPRPLVEREDDGTMVLAFTAPKTGRYRLMAGAKPGCSGVGEVRVIIEPMKNECRTIMHTSAPIADAGSVPSRGQQPMQWPAPQRVPSQPPAPPLYEYPNPLPPLPGDSAPLGIDPNAQAYLQVPAGR